MKKRVLVLKIFFASFAFLILIKAAHLASQKDERLARLAKRQFRSQVSVLPRRGLIFDRNGEGLAISLKARSLFFRPEFIKKEMAPHERQRVLKSLSRILEIPLATLQSKMNSEKGFVWIKRQLSPSVEQTIRDKGLLDYGEGIGLAEETKRYYPNNDLASHVLGSVNVDGQGLEGLELYYESVLKGENVRISSTKDAMGRRVFKGEQGLLAFKDGQSLILTIDKYLQYESEKALKGAIEALAAKAGTIILAEVQTGEILAMANYPTFDPNQGRSPLENRRNRAITDTYEPGSTFKPFIIGMSLEQGKSARTQVYCEEGKFVVSDRVISEAETHEKWGWLSYGEILKYSSNIGAAKIALDLGPQSILHLIDKLELGKRTEIGLPGEVTGTTNKKEIASPVRRANLGFGHGLTVTPLQMLSYYLAIANKGTWIQPRIVKAVLSESPDALENGAIRYRLGTRFDVGKTKKIFSEHTSRVLTSMLETVVQEKGTGVAAALEEWTVAGKTGTAQKVDPETRRYSHNKYIASFVGYAPSSNPKLVALVLLDEPQKGYYGGQTAAPVFKEVMRAGLLHQRVKPLNDKLQLIQLANLNALSAVQKSAPEPEKIESKETSEISGLRVPDFRGKTVREVLRMIQQSPLKDASNIEIIGSGVLRDQVPAPLQPIGENSSGAKIKLIFSET